MAKRARKKEEPSKRSTGTPSPSAESTRAAVSTLLAGNDKAEELLSLFEGLTDERDALRAVRDALTDQRDALSDERDALAAEHERQALRIQQLRSLLYGRRTEKLTQEELQQLALAFGASEEEARKPEPEVPHPALPDAGESDAAPEGEQPSHKKKRKPRARTQVRADVVERLVRDVVVPADERTCACCHREMQVIDHVERSWLEHVPAKFVQHVDRIEKVACRHSDCRGDIHSPARSPDRPERRRVDASLLAHLVQAKCDDALPIDRQRDQFARMGVTFPLNTLYSYWTYATTLLSPVAKVILARTTDDYVVGVDDTKLRVLDRKRAGGSYKGCLWCFTGTGPLVAYTFTESWEAKAIAPYIGAIAGFIQCDDYKGYGSVVAMPDGTERVLVDPERRLGCMMHVRRRFYDALKLGDKRSARAVELIAALYEVEADAKERALAPPERLALRTERALPLMNQFDSWVDETKPKCTPKSPLARALGYAAQQRPFIRRCLTDGRFEIDNGHTERTLRRPCIGRNNYLFTGSPAAAARLADAYTLVQSSRNAGIDTRVYLIDVIQKLEAGWPMRRIGELVPDLWAEHHGSASQRDDPGK